MSTHFFMAECYRCGVPEEREKLFDAVSNKGVVKVCRRCANEDDHPLVQPVDLNKPEKVKSVYERLSAMANLDPVKHRVAVTELEREEEMKRQRGSSGGIRRPPIVPQTAYKKPEPRKDLIPNYHWTIMRARRAKKLSQKQLAENIGESEVLIKAAEEGMLMDNTDMFLRKLESYFGIKLRQGAGGNDSQFINTERLSDPTKQALMQKLENGKFDKDATQNLTIGDLKDAKEKKKESGGLFSFFRRKKEDSKPETDEKLPTSKEADDILYGK